MKAGHWNRKLSARMPLETATIATCGAAKREAHDQKLQHSAKRRAAADFPEFPMSMVMHLAEAKPGQLTTSYKHYYIERPCRILVVGQHLKTKTKYQCLLRHISVGGAMVDFNANILLPKHFFLQIDGFQEEIGCSQVHRHRTELGVRFNMQLAPEFLSRLIRMDFTSGLI
jgi:hypothetical protein